MLALYCVLSLFRDFIGLQFALRVLECIGLDEAGHSRRDSIGAARVPIQGLHDKMALLAREERIEVDRFGNRNSMFRTDGFACATLHAEGGTVLDAERSIF